MTTEICPERDVIRRVRKQVGFSWPSLAKSVGDFECNIRALEERTRPMKADERALMVKLLSFMLSCRFDYPSDMKAWRQKHGMTLRQAADFAGVAVNTWYKIESGKCRRWPYASVKARIDRLLDGSRFESAGGLPANAERVAQFRDVIHNSIWKVE